jgi:phosphoserine phosphatase
MNWIAVLTASPARGVADAEARDFASLLEGEAVRLGPAAVEVACAGRPDLAGLRAAFPEHDVNAVPAEGRRKRLLIADMDSTLIPVECIDEVAAAAGVGDRVAAITERAMAGELDFEGALRERVALVAGLAEAALEEVHRTRVTLNPGAETLVRTMAAHGAHTMLVSGGYTFFADRVGQAAGFAEVRANRLLIEDGRLTGRVAEPILGKAAKLAALEEALAARGLAAADALAVGDGANDLAMIEAAGLGVAYRPKPLLAERADAVIRQSGLDALLALQGYRAEEHRAAEAA